MHQCHSVSCFHGYSSPPPGNRSTKPEDMRGAPYYKPAYTTAQGIPFTGMQVAKDGRFGFENGVTVLDSRMYGGTEFPGVCMCVRVVRACACVVCTYQCVCLPCCNVCWDVGRTFGMWCDQRLVNLAMVHSLLRALPSLRVCVRV